MKRCGQPADVDQRDVALASFDPAKVAAGKSTFKSERLLGKTCASAQFGNVPPKRHPGIRLANSARLSFHGHAIYASGSYQATLYK